MAFRLCGAPRTFQSAMNTTLWPLLRKGVLVFFDDILIYNHSVEEHIKHLTQVLQLLPHNQWCGKLFKCTFAQHSYLGHIICAQVIATDPPNLDAIESWLVSSIVKNLCRFLGLIGYYRKFVRNFVIIARPLTDLLKKNTLFIWTSDHDSYFRELKQALMSAPLLVVPNFNKPFAWKQMPLNTGWVLSCLRMVIHSLANCWDPRIKVCPHTKRSILLSSLPLIRGGLILSYKSLSYTLTKKAWSIWMKATLAYTMATTIVHQITRPAI